MFKPNAVYYEPNSENYELGKRLLKKYKEMGVPLIEIENHNNIPEMRAKENKEFPQMKRNLIIGTRKTQKFEPNHKTSDFLVPYTSSGCIAMCMYCYLVCHYNKCAYLRLFVNREQLLDKIINYSLKSEKELIFEIGSNSDLVLENIITENLEWTIEKFAKEGRGYLTLPTKFSYVESLLNLDHRGKTIIRMSLNPEMVINKIEFGTSNLNDRIEAIKKLYNAGYKVGILIAPIVFIDNWKDEYEKLIKKLSEELTEEQKNNIFFEFIFMTYSYVHKMINPEAFPNALILFDKEKMTGRGKGKYMYKKELREEGTEFIKDMIKKYLPSSEIKYIV